MNEQDQKEEAVRLLLAVEKKLKSLKMVFNDQWEEQTIIGKTKFFQYMGTGLTVTISIKR